LFIKRTLDLMWDIHAGRALIMLLGQSTFKTIVPSPHNGRTRTVPLFQFSTLGCLAACFTPGGSVAAKAVQKIEQQASGV
jgi:hypothetical protein